VPVNFPVSDCSFVGEKANNVWPMANQRMWRDENRAVDGLLCIAASRADAAKLLLFSDSGFSAESRYGS